MVQPTIAFVFPTDDMNNFLFVLFGYNIIMFTYTSSVNPKRHTVNSLFIYLTSCGIDEGCTIFMTKYILYK